MAVGLLKNVKILVVDDEVSICEILSEELTLVEADVTKANSGNEAYEILAKEKFDIVVTDMKMPHGDGLSLIKNINEKLHYKPLMFICSGFHKLSNDEIKTLNVVAALEKPFSIMEFLKVVPFPKLG